MRALRCPYGLSARVQRLTLFHGLLILPLWAPALAQDNAGVGSTVTKVTNGDATTL